jgi:hypothetical protein
VSSLQVVLVLIGWVILFYLNNRTLRRSEISRIKDRLIERIDAVRSWYVDEVRLDSDGLNRLSLEQNLSAHVSQIELRMGQLNDYLGVDILDFDSLAHIRTIDNDKSRPLQEIIEEVHVKFLDLSERIEVSYDRFFGSRWSFKKIWLVFRYELLGAFFSAGLIFLLTSIFRDFADI